MLTMQLPEIMQWLEANKDERGIKVWARLRDKPNNMGSFGLGITKLKQFSKKVGKNHELALQLWEQPYLDTMMLSTFVEEPKKVTEEQMKQQIENGFNWILVDKYCENILSKTPFAQKKAEEWLQSKEEMTKRAAYIVAGILAQTDKQLPDAWFEQRLAECANLQQEQNFVKEAMNMALMRIGSRNPGLHAQALNIAKQVGTVVVDYGDNSCITPDALKALSKVKDTAK